MGRPKPITSAGEWAIVVLTVGIAFLFYWIRSLSMRYRITTQRVQIEHGLFSTTKDNVELFRIDHFDLHKPFGMRIMNECLLHLRSSDPHFPTVMLRGIPGLEALPDTRARMLAPGARAPACYDVRRGLTTNDSSGDVAKVVANAMITVIENSRRRQNAQVEADVETTSSTSPRVLSRMPICNASAHVMPVARAATAEPIPLPATATASISTVSPTSAQSLMSGSDVRRPLEAKKSGKSSAVVIGSMRSVKTRSASAARGMMTPAKNAPKSAWTPRTSVA